MASNSFSFIHHLNCLLNIAANMAASFEEELKDREGGYSWFNWGVCVCEWVCFPGYYLCHFTSGWQASTFLSIALFGKLCDD